MVIGCMLVCCSLTSPKCHNGLSLNFQGRFSLIQEYYDTIDCNEGCLGFVSHGKVTCFYKIMVDVMIVFENGILIEFKPP